MTVKIQYQNWLLVALFVGVAVLFAPLAVWASARHAADKRVIGRGALRSLSEWLKSNLVAVIAGFVAATGAFVASYWADPAWGAKVPEQWFTLLGTVWASATGSATVGSLASKGGSAVRKRNS